MPQPRLNNSNDLIDKISSIGLTEKEAKVYSVLLEMGGAFPSAIAVAAKMNRSTTYKILTSLAVKGLVVEMRRRNRLYYQVERPNKLTRFAKDQISLAEERSDKVKQLLPEIEGLYSVLPSKPRMRFFEGFPEVLSVHEDHVADDEKYEMLAWANADKIAKFLPESLKKGYLKKKEQLGIKTRAIVPDTKEDRNYNRKVYKGISKTIWPDLRFISEREFPYPVEITIYGTNKVSILNFSRETPIGLIIEDQIIHDMMTMVFNLSWKGASIK